MLIKTKKNLDPVYVSKLVTHHQTSRIEEKEEYSVNGTNFLAEPSEDEQEVMIWIQSNSRWEIPK